MRFGIRPNTDEYVTADGRRLLLLSEGRLVNLTAAEGHPAAVMDMSFSAQALAVAWLAKESVRLTPGVYDVPAEIDTEVARLKLAAADVEIDTLTDDQEQYLHSCVSVHSGSVEVGPTAHGVAAGTNAESGRLHERG